MTITNKLSARQRGDFQTPEELAHQVWATLDASRFELVIEPTFGLGSFITTMPSSCRADITGWEIYADYYLTTIDKLRELKHSRRINLLQRDVFSVSGADINITPNSRVLVIGNTPWVTNSEQGSLGGENTGEKHNLKNLSGLDAMTGKANFDISEAIILRFVNLLKERCELVQFALLTKFSVLKNLMKYLSRHSCIGDFEFHRIDAFQYFGASVDAGLVKFKVGGEPLTRFRCPIYQDIAGARIGEVAFLHNRLIYDLEKYERTSFMESCGRNYYVWRQGVKHDLNTIMALSVSEDGLRNNLGEAVDVEEQTLYQLYKSSDIFHGRESRFVVPIYQQDLRDTLESLQIDYPKLHAYLQRHKARFFARKSSIYKNRPAFTMFGVGSYTHCTYKVAIGSLYTEPVFRLLKPSPRPVVIDDTGYMLATDVYEEAVYLVAILNLDCARDFLMSITHSREKRRFSKEVLVRILIPPMYDCPLDIRSMLMNSWESTRAVSSNIKRQVEDWLFTYGTTRQLQP